MIQHDLVAGAEYDFETSDPRYFTNNGLTNTLLNPNENQTFSPTLTYPAGEYQHHHQHRRRLFHRHDEAETSGN